MDKGSEDIKMCNKQMKTCSTSLVSGDIKIKTTMKLSLHTHSDGYYQKQNKNNLPPPPDNNKWWLGYGEMEPLCIAGNIKWWSYFKCWQYPEVKHCWEPPCLVSEAITPLRLRLSQSWDHRPQRRQCLSPWQVCHLCPLHPAWP